MRTMVLVGPQQAVMQVCEPPAPGAGQVRVRLEGCGVCGSNLAVWQGQPWTRYPLTPGAPGHEGWGIVDAVGDGVQTVAAGQRVALLSEHAYAEYDIADAESVLPLPAALAARPFPGEALACAVNVMRRADVRPGSRIAIVGIGFLGALLVRLAAHRGAVVTAISRRAFALDIAHRQGAADRVALADVPGAVRQARLVAGSDDYATVIEVGGTQTTLDVASALVGVRGRLVVAGYHQDGPRSIDMQSWNWRGLDVVNAHERDQHTYMEGLRTAVDLAVRGEWDPWTLVTDVLPLGDLNRALGLVASRPHGFMKAVVTS